MADSLTVIPEDRPSKGTPSVTKSESLPVGLLKLDNGNGKGAIALADITHVTVEDHYCRVSYTTGNGLRSEMIRLPLMEILRKLPETHFLHIHRSHVVNKKYISHLAKKGLDHKIVLQRYDVQLPVSRSRFQVLHTSMKGAAISK